MPTELEKLISNYEGEDCYLTVKIAVEGAYALGRQQGLEEAAKVAEANAGRAKSRGDKEEESEHRFGWRMAIAASSDIATEVRALKEGGE